MSVRACMCARVYGIFVRGVQVAVEIVISTIVVAVIIGGDLKNG